MTNIAIICDRKEDRQQVVNLLSSHDDFNIASVGKDGFDALRAVEKLKPDVVIMDLRLPGIDGPELAPIIKRKSPETALMVLSSQDEKDHLADRALKAGISGYLLKQADMDKLAPSVRIVSYGGYYISASIIDQVFGAVSLLKQFPGQAPQFSKRWFNYKINHQEFSAAERGILSLISQGLTDKEIAKKLNFNQSTIRNMVTQMKRKTGLQNRTQLVLYAFTYGLVSFDKINIPKAAPRSKIDRKP